MNVVSECFTAGFRFTGWLLLTLLCSFVFLSSELRANDTMEVMVLRAPKASADQLVTASKRADLDSAVFVAGVNQMVKAGRVTEVFRGVRPLGGQINIADRKPPLVIPDDIKMPMGMDLMFETDKSEVGLYDVVISFTLAAPTGKKFESSNIACKSRFIMRPDDWTVAAVWDIEDSSTLLLMKVDGKLEDSKNIEDVTILETSIEFFLTTENDAAKFMKSGEDTRSKAVDWFHGQAEELASITLPVLPSGYFGIRLGNDKIIDENGWTTVLGGVDGYGEYRLVDKVNQMADLRLDLKWSSPDAKTTVPGFEFKQSIIVKDSLTEMVMPSKKNAVGKDLVVALVTSTNLRTNVGSSGGVQNPESLEAGKAERISIGDDRFRATYPIPVSFIQWLERGAGHIPQKNPNVHIPPTIKELLTAHGLPMKEADQVVIEWGMKLYVTGGNDVHDIIEGMIEKCKNESK